MDLSLWLNKMSIEEKDKLYSYLSGLIIKKFCLLKLKKVFDINNIKEAIVLQATLIEMEKY